MERKLVGITDTIFRDAHQSLLATRLQTKDMVEITEIMDSVGYHSLEVWGGATFDSCMRYLEEDPWERLRTLRKRMPNTKLQMLLRGQNLLGYRQYPDDVVDEFVAKSIENGIDIIRSFDALNDTRNLERAVAATKKYGGHAQGTIVYTVSPVHTIETFVKVAKQLREIGSDSVAIKDMAGLLTPHMAQQLVTQLKAELDIPVHLHTHYTSGMASMTYWAGIEAGVDVVDTALSPLSMGTSQPPTESLVAALAETNRPTELDLELLAKASRIFRKVLEGYKKPTVHVDTTVLTSQIPGGMLSNLHSQLESQKMGDRYPEIVEEVPRVRKDMGYPPLVTPMSQIVGVQALFNVITGQRYAVKSKEIKEYVAGNYGRPPVPIDEDVRSMLVDEGEVLEGRPADYLEPVLDKFRAEIKDMMIQEEDVLSYALFPEVAKRFFKIRQEKQGAAR